MNFTDEQYKKYRELYIKSGSIRQIDRINARTRIPEMAKELGDDVMKAMYEKAKKELGE